MHNRKKFGSPGKGVLATLLALGLLAWFLPRSWTSGLMSLVQVIVPFQDAAGGAADTLSDAFTLDGKDVPASQYQQAVSRTTELEHLVTSLSSRIKTLESENELLSGTRLWSTNGRRFGANGKLIPARVIAEDMVPWRSSRLVNAGTLQGIRPDAAVASNRFSLGLGAEDDVRQGMAILLREALIGYVEDVGTHTSRVKLLSDPTTQMRVNLGRLESDRIDIHEESFWLTGKGGGRMEIENVQRRDIEVDRIGIGDIVLTPAYHANLPTSMCIGQVSAIRPDQGNPLLVILDVTARINENELTRVYIYQPESMNVDR